MAQQQNLIDRKGLCCSICLDLLKDPATIPCGHSYCMNCIEIHWDKEVYKKVYSCPQCRQTFHQRSALVKNTMLADLVEEVKKSESQTAPSYQSYAGPKDVACDFCTGRKLKALKSCLQCLVSYCEQHLQPHYESPAFKKHKLVDPLRRVQENICSHHGKVIKIFCRTDQQCICYLCSMDKHKDHQTVLASEEWTVRQGELGPSRQRIQKRIHEREEDVKLLQQKVEAILHAADKAVTQSDIVFNQLARIIKSRGFDVKQEIRSRLKIEVSPAKKLLEKLQQEITELKRKDAELKQLSQTEDHIQFLHNYPALSQISESMDSPSTDICPLQYFEDAMAAVSEVRVKLQDILSDVWTKVSLTETQVDVLLPQAEPKTRDEFLQYSCQITMDPNTASTELLLSEGNRKATVTSEKQPYSSHPDRFTDMFQVLNRESLSGSHYWEVERSRSEVAVAVTYKDISRTGYESGFGNDGKSWTLECFNNSYAFRHNSVSSFISGPQSSKIGVFLDHRAGILSFYSVSDTMTLLHRVKTTFTQPLYIGLGVFGSHGSGSTAEIYKLE